VAGNPVEANVELDVEMDRDEKVETMPAGALHDGASRPRVCDFIVLPGGSRVIADWGCFGGAAIVGLCAVGVVAAVLFIFIVPAWQCADRRSGSGS